MSNQKSNPVMSPEWIKSLMSVDVVPLEQAPVDRVSLLASELTKAIGVEFTENAARALLEIVDLMDRPRVEQSTADAPPVDRGLLEGTKFIIEDALRDLQAVKDSLAALESTIRYARTNILVLEEDAKP